MNARPSSIHAQQALTALADADLLSRLHQLISRDRALTAHLLVHLAEVDARGLYRAQAYASMFDYAVHALHMSESEAYVRIRVARLSRQFPAILPLLERNELHLSALKLLAPVLDRENCAELLENARFKTKSEVEAMLARRFAKADVRSVIRRLPVRSAAGATARQPGPQAKVSESVVTAAPDGAGAGAPQTTVAPSTVETAELKVAADPELPSFQLAPPLDSPSRSPGRTVEPLSAARYKIQFTADQQLHDKIKQAQDLLRHQAPDGDLAIVVERALDLLIADRLKQRFALVSKPRRAATAASVEPKPGSRHIPHDVRRAVIARDGLRCTYASADGQRCEQRGLLELHHEEPHGRGGASSIENVRLLCRAHNLLLAERDYGREVVRQRIDARRSATRISGPSHSASQTAE